MEPLRITVRRAAPEDREAWVDMRQALWPHEEREALARDVDDFFSGGTPFLAEVFMAHHACGLAVLGFLELGLRAYANGCESSPVPHVEGWYVASAYRRKGVGAALIAAAEHWARAHGYSELTSDGLLENETGYKAHRAAGFEEVERLIAFRKNLSSSAKNVE